MKCFTCGEHGHLKRAYPKAKQNKVIPANLNVVTVGELSHCALGFYGGHWSPLGDSILAHGYGGSFHLWKNVDNDNCLPQKVPSGHFASVTDIAWARSGDYILSVSHDQVCCSYQNSCIKLYSL